MQRRWNVRRLLPVRASVPERAALRTRPELAMRAATFADVADLARPTEHFDRLVDALLRVRR